MEPSPSGRRPPVGSHHRAGAPEMLWGPQQPPPRSIHPTHLPPRKVMLPPFGPNTVAHRTGRPLRRRKTLDFASDGLRLRIQVVIHRLKGAFARELNKPTVEPLPYANLPKDLTSPYVFSPFQDPPELKSFSTHKSGSTPQGCPGPQHGANSDHPGGLSQGVLGCWCQCHHWSALRCP